MTRIANLIVLLICCQSIFADEQSIGSLFNSYQEHLNNGEYLMALDQVNQAHDISIIKYGSEHATTQKLKINLAKLYVEQRERNPDFDDSHAKQLLREYIHYQTAEEGKWSINLIDPLMSLGTVHLWYKSKLLGDRRSFRDRNRRFGGDRITANAVIRDGRFKAISLFERAIGIAEKHIKQHPLLVADLKFEVAKSLFGRGIEFDRATKMLIYSYNDYSANLTAIDARVILSAFYIAKSFALSGDFEQSNEYYKRVVIGYKQAGHENHAKVIESYIAIVANYEQLGMSDKATPYCVAIGQLRPWLKAREQESIYSPSIELSVSNKIESAQARLRLTIDIHGKVSEVEELAYEGGRELLPIILKAIKKRRYAPNIINSVAIESTTEAIVSIQ